MARTANSSIDYTSKDYEAFRNMMITNLQVIMPEYTDTRQSDAGIVIIELLAMGLDILSFYQDVYANEAYLTTAEQRENVLKWCSMLGYTPKYATPARFKQVFYLSAKQTENVVIPAGTIVKTNSASGEAEVKFETERSLTIPAGYLGNEKDSSEDYMYTVDIVQGTSVNDELVGSSTGAASQSFTLAFPDVIIDDSFIIKVNQGWGFETWQRVENFIESNANSKHYVVSLNDNAEATITFGDGVFGAIPKAGSNNIYASYRVGGGDIGNVGANRITQLDTKIALVEGTFNPDLAYEQGQEAETLDEIRVNAPIANRTRFGAITLEDFSDVVMKDFDFVKYAISKRDEEDPDDIHIYVILEDNETLTETIKENILTIFNENDGGRKVVGADEIIIEAATYTSLTLTATLVVDEYHQKETVEDEVEAYLTNYFAKGNYPFGKDLSFSALASEIFQNIDGVKAFKFTSPTDDVKKPAVGEVYTMTSVTFTTTGGIDTSGG